MARLILLAAAALAAPGCGSTVVRSADPQARIYVDGELAGIGEVELRRFGPSHDFEVKVQEFGAETVVTVEREFTALTVLIGLVTGYTGLFWAWELPDEVTLPARAEQVNPWTHQPEGAWARP
ncbi:MAG: hypothetical protein R3F60_29580 [bacterium]